MPEETIEAPDLYASVIGLLKMRKPWGSQRPKNLGSRVALLPGKFLCVQNFLRLLRLLNCPNTFKMIRIFPDDFQFSRWFQNCPHFSRCLPIFRMISKLSGFSRWLPIFWMISKLSGLFQMTDNFPDDFKTVRIFPDDCQFSGWLQKCSDFSRCRW